MVINKAVLTDLGSIDRHFLTILMPFDNAGALRIMTDLNNLTGLSIFSVLRVQDVFTTFDILAAFDYFDGYKVLTAFYGDNRKIDLEKKIVM